MSEKSKYQKEDLSQVIEHTETSERIEQMRKRLDEMGAELLKQGKPLNDPALLKQANLVKASLDEEKLGQLDNEPEGRK